MTEDTNEQEGCHHDTAVGEASHRILQTIEALKIEYKDTKFYHLRKRAYLSGMMMAFAMVVSVLESLARKYDNQRGTFN